MERIPPWACAHEGFCGGFAMYDYRRFKHGLPHDKGAITRFVFH